MLLHEIISENENHASAIEYGQLHPYLKSLYTYYKRQFCCEPVLMVTAVFNAAQYAKIVPSNDFSDAIEAYMNGWDGFTEDEINSEIEVISFNSRLLKDLIK